MSKHKSKRRTERKSRQPAEEAKPHEDRPHAIPWKDPRVIAAIVGSLITAAAVIIVGTTRNSSEIKDAILDLQETMRTFTDSHEELMKRNSGLLLPPTQPVPDSGDVREALAVEFYTAGMDAVTQGRIKQAIGHFLDALLADQDLPGAHNVLGYAYQVAGEFEKAIRHYKKATQDDSEDFWAYNNLGVALMAQGRLDEAIDALNEALRIDSHNGEPHNNLGIALLNRGAGGSLGLLEHDLERGLTILTTPTAAIRVGVLDEVIHHFTEARDHDPDHARYRTNLGGALAAKGSLSEAIEQFKEALRIDPDLVAGHYNLAEVLRLNGVYGGAIEHYEKTLRLRPEFADAHNQLGVALAATGDLDGALMHFKKAIEFDPEQARAHYNIGCMLAQGDDTEGAIRALTKAISLDPVLFRKEAKTDTDYDPIRSDPRFQKLVYDD